MALLLMNVLTRNFPALSLVLSMTLAVLGGVLTFSGFESSAMAMIKAASGVLFLLALCWGALLLRGGDRIPVALEKAPILPAFTDTEGRLLVLLGVTLPIGEGPAYVAAGLLLLRILWRRDQQAVPLSPIFRKLSYGLVIWIGAGVIAYVVSGHGWIRPKELGRILPFVVTPLVAFAALNLDSKWHRRAVIGFCYSLTLSCGVALFQYGVVVEADGVLMDLVGRFSSQNQLRAPGQGNRLVAGGFYFHRLKMAHVLIFGVSLIFCRQCFKELSPRVRLVEAAVGVLFISVLFLTYTRAALLGVVGGAVVVLWFASRKWRLASLLIALVIGGVAVSDLHIRERVLSIGDSAASSERSLIWSRAIEMIHDYPVGVGLGNYPSLIDSYYQGVAGAASIPRTYAHNLLLSAWAETGPLGLLGYLWLWVIPGFVCWNCLRNSSSTTDELKWVAATGLMVLISFWGVGLTHDVLYHKPVSLTFAAFIGLLCARISKGDSVNSIGPGLNQSPTS